MLNLTELEAENARLVRSFQIAIDSITMHRQYEKELQKYVSELEFMVKELYKLAEEGAK